MSESKDFNWVEGPEPHRARTRAIVRAHPEVKNLIGKNPMTFVWILASFTNPFHYRTLVRSSKWF